jgi:nucleoside-diphosphate kinase
MNEYKYERTLVLIKHDGVARGLIGDIISRFEKVGLKIIAMKLVLVDVNRAEKHYPDSDEWYKNIGDRIISNYKEKNIDVKKDFSTDDPIEIGKTIKSFNKEYLLSGPVVAMVLEGPEAIKIVRKLLGKTNPLESEPGTIRGDYTWDNNDTAGYYKRPIYNLMHASSSVEDSEYEIKLWFNTEEIFNYKTSSQDFMGWSGKL